MKKNEIIKDEYVIAKVFNKHFVDIVQKLGIYLQKNEIKLRNI